MKNPFTKRKPSPSSLTPQERFDKAAANKDYSNKACTRSCKPKTVILTGVEAGEEKDWVPGKEEKVARRLKNILSSKAQGRNRGEEQDVYIDKGGQKPAYASLGITWVQRGLWNGRKAHFLLLRVEHQRGAAHYLQRVEFTLRAWKAGDALKSIAERSDKPLSAISPPLALEFSAAAPEIALYGPRAVVGRPYGTPVDCFWDGHFQPGDHWKYFAELRTPQHRATFLRPTNGDVWSMLHAISFGDYDLKEPAHDFTIGMVIISDGEPFDLTAYSTSHHAGRDPVRQYLWTPYEPVRINGSMRILPKGQKPIKVDFGSQEMRMRWKELVEWSKPYDTVPLSLPMGDFRLMRRYILGTSRGAWTTRALPLAVVLPRVATAARHIPRLRLACCAIPPFVLPLKPLKDHSEGRQLATADENIGRVGKARLRFHRI